MATTKEITDIFALQKHNIEFPNIEDFNELFTEYKIWQSSELSHKSLLTLPSWDAKPRQYNPPTFSVGSYLQFSNGSGQPYRNSLEIIAVADCLLDYVKNNMLHVSNDTTHFCVNLWRDNRALITISYGQIIGSRWLAIINAATVPDTTEKKTVQ